MAVLEAVVHPQSMSKGRVDSVTSRLDTINNCNRRISCRQETEVLETGIDNDDDSSTPSVPSDNTMYTATEGPAMDTSRRREEEEELLICSWTESPSASCDSVLSASLEGSSVSSYESVRSLSSDDSLNMSSTAPTDELPSNDDPTVPQQQRCRIDSLSSSESFGSLATCQELEDPHPLHGSPPLSRDIDTRSDAKTLHRPLSPSMPLEQQQQQQLLLGEPPQRGERVRKIWTKNKRRASKMLTKPKKLLRRAKQRASSWVIPSNHPLKLIWDILTVLVSLFSIYQSHKSIRDRRHDQTEVALFCEVWFFMDILLNFVTDHRSSDGRVVIRDGKAIWARYLTTWFIVDAMSLVPWERHFVKPIIEMQNRRNLFQKSFFRSKAVLRVTSRIFRGRYVKNISQIVKHSRHYCGPRKLVQFIIKYVPKYVLFYRNMRCALAFRSLRQIHWMRKVSKNIWLFLKPQKEEEEEYIEDEDEYVEGDDDEEDEYIEDDSFEDVEDFDDDSSTEYEDSCDEDDGYTQELEESSLFDEDDDFLY